MPEASSSPQPAEPARSAAHTGAGRRVLALDSGVGGLTVVGAIRGELPGLAISYVADSAAFPYGRLSEAALIARLTGLVERCLAADRYDAIVIACNTASTTVLDALRSQFPVPFVGVVPPIKSAGTLSRTRSFGLLATPGTVSRTYVDELIRRFAPDCRVVRVGSPELAPMAEAHLRGLPVDRHRVEEILRPLFGPDAPPVDAVALGCTHYPILLPIFTSLAPAHVAWLDPAPAVARRVRHVLSECGRLDEPLEDGRGPHRLWFTSPADGTSVLHAYLADLGFGPAAVWPDGR